VQKQALALVEQGHKLYQIAGKLPNFCDIYESFMVCSHLDQYIESIKVLASKVDVFHAHNEPSWFVHAVKEHCDVPVILDVHDSYLARITPGEEDRLKSEGKQASRVITEERNNFQLADGLVFPGDRFGALVKSEYKLDQPSITLPSYLPRKLFKYDTREWLGGLVYEGRVDIKEDIEKGNNYGFRYADYEEFAVKAQELGIDFHLYVTRKDDKFISVYDDISYVHKPKAFDQLLKSIGRHDWGLVGNLTYTPEWDIAFPNKMFEYIATCLPIVVMKAAACAEFVLEHDIGIVVDSMEELRDRWSEHERCRKNLMVKRQEFAMDTHINKLEELYTSVTNKARYDSHTSNLVHCEAAA
jgi:glycosyltransferase involved in cell wall biosynthesis